MTPALVPTLDALAADPTKALGLPPDVRRRLALEAIAVAHVLAVVEGAAGVAEAIISGPPDATLTVVEAAARLRVASTTLARWTRTKPEWAACVVARSQNMIRLSAARFELTMRDTAGSPAPTRPAASERHTRPLARPGTGTRGVGR